MQDRYRPYLDTGITDGNSMQPDENFNNYRNDEIISNETQTLLGHENHGSMYPDDGQVSPSKQVCHNCNSHLYNGSAAVDRYGDHPKNLTRAETLPFQSITSSPQTRRLQNIKRQYSVDECQLTSNSRKLPKFPTKLNDFPDNEYQQRNSYNNHPNEYKSYSENNAQRFRPLQFTSTPSERTNATVREYGNEIDRLNYSCHDCGGNMSLRSENNYSPARSRSSEDTKLSGGTAYLSNGSPCSEIAAASAAAFKQRNSSSNNPSVKPQTSYLRSSSSSSSASSTTSRYCYDYFCTLHKYTISLSSLSTILHFEHVFLAGTTINGINFWKTFKRWMQERR